MYTKILKPVLLCEFRFRIFEEIGKTRCDRFLSIIYNSNDRYKDLFFALSHGVHRGKLKSGKEDDRIIFLEKLQKIP